MASVRGVCGVCGESNFGALGSVRGAHRRTVGGTVRAKAVPWGQSGGERGGVSYQRAREAMGRRWTVSTVASLALYLLRKTWRVPRSRSLQSSWRLRLFCRASRTNSS